MKKILVISLLLVFIFNSVTYCFETDRFSANFPSEPRISKVKQSVDNNTLDITNYQASDDNGLYIVSFGRLSVPLTSHRSKVTFMANLFKGLTKSQNTVKIYAKELSEKPPYDVSYLYTSNYKGIKWLHMGLIYLNGDNEYVKISVVYPANLLELAKNKYDQFLDSVKIK